VSWRICAIETTAKHCICAEASSARTGTFSPPLSKLALLQSGKSARPGGFPRQRLQPPPPLLAGDCDSWIHFFFNVVAIVDDCLLRLVYVS
jgi:hypothetical protein